MARSARPLCRPAAHHLLPADQLPVLLAALGREDAAQHECGLATWNSAEFVTIVGRKDDMVVSGGENVHPVHCRAREQAAAECAQGMFETA
ncbi:hypothetical protein [Bounagaea algeriensis]